MSVLQGRNLPNTRKINREEIEIGRQLGGGALLQSHGAIKCDLNIVPTIDITYTYCHATRNLQTFRDSN
jgi:hypothetical protein